MKKSDMLRELKKQGVVAVVRGQTQEEGIEISKACIQGGLKAIEVTYTNKYASAIICDLKELYKNDHDVHIGAGTVLDAATAHQAIEYGAQFIVSPAFDIDTARLCQDYDIPYIPGCMTVQEIVTAMKAGSDMIKLFPGNVFSPDYIKAVKSPLPQVSMMVTGGVSLDNVEQWFDAGASAIGIGGELNQLGMAGKYDDVMRVAKAYVEKTKEARRL